MAFMMPVMKNEFDIYNGSRTRKASELCNSSSNNGQRARKVSECKSECQTSSTSPSSSHHMQMMNRSASSRAAFVRNSSRSSQTNMFAASPTRNYSNNNNNNINNNQAACSPATKTHSGSQGSLNKFHNRLVDKLRKSFRKDTAKRSWELSQECYANQTFYDIDNNCTTTSTFQVDDDDDDDEAEFQQQSKSTTVSIVVKSKQLLQQKPNSNSEDDGVASSGTDLTAPQPAYRHSGRFLSMKQRITKALSRRKSKKQCHQCCSSSPTKSTTMTTAKTSKPKKSECCRRLQSDTRAGCANSTAALITYNGVDNYGAISSTAELITSSEIVATAALCDKNIDDNISGAEQGIVLIKQPSHRRSILRRQRQSATSRFSSFSAPG